MSSEVIDVDSPDVGTTDVDSFEETGPGVFSRVERAIEVVSGVAKEENELLAVGIVPN